VTELSFERAQGWPGQRVAGVDEAGRGAWCGPVVAAAVILPEGFDIAPLADSKKLSPKRRASLRLVIEEQAQVGVGFADAGEIDKINILQATFLAMQRALAKLSVDFVLIDGNKAPQLAVDYQTIIGGDNISASIAAASIIAKETRDDWVRDVSGDYQQYGWAQNKGYGTKDHRSAVQEYGPTDFHRMSFRPMRDMQT
jgi:ribonuclease HII